jgi:arylsulfatase A-like enzyme/Tfp pilus assembly protein PilF
MKTHLRYLLVCIVLSAGVVFASPVAPPNVILITLDTIRADRMGFLGSKAGLTPNLDSLARQAVVFPRTYAHVPLTTPSHATILTGTYPQFSHVADLGDPLARNIPFVPDILHQRGYATAAFVGSQVLDPKSVAVPGFDRGFDTYDANFHSRQIGEDRYASVERRGAIVVSRAVSWLEDHRSGPFFLWVHLYDAHEPYDPPAPFKAPYSSAPYDGEIAYVDFAVGNLLKALREKGLYDHSLIAVVADHGEAFGEHGEQSHGFFLYDETVHVPFLLKLPGERLAGTRVAAPVGLVDIAPTLLSEIKVLAPQEMQGSPLQSLMGFSGASSALATKLDNVAEQPQYSETDYPLRAFGWSPLRALRAGRYLYIDAPRRELYDQIVDPQESQNIANNSKAVADTLASQLEKFHQRTSSVITNESHMTMDQAEQLRGLGYISSGMSQSQLPDEARGADPKDRIEIANLFHRALLAMEVEDYRDAIAPLEQVLKEEPNLGLANLELGRALNRLENYQAALPWLRNAVRLSPESGRAHMELGMALVETDNWAESTVELETALARAPDSEEIYFALATAYEKLGRTQDASQAYQHALRLNPDDYRANLFFGRLLAMNGDPTSALPLLQKAVKLQPESPDAHKFLANAYVELGQDENANRERIEAKRWSAKP